MSLLHVGPAINTSLVMNPAANGTNTDGNGGRRWQGIDVADGLHCHVLLTLTIPDFSTVVSIEIRAGAGADGAEAEAEAGAGENAPGSVMLNISRGKIQLGRSPDVQGCNGKQVTISNSSTVHVEIFVDGVATEVFVNGGERALTSSAQAMYIQGQGLRATSTNGTATLRATTWAMKQTVLV
jgi:hypothetical protein